MIAGRPLRFLLLSIGGWTGLRAIALWPVAGSIVPRAQASATGKANDGAIVPTLGRIASTPFPSGSPSTAWPGQPDARAVSNAEADPKAEAGRRIIAPRGIVADDNRRAHHAESAIPPPLAPAPLATAPSRWAVSAWLIARGGSRGGLLGGQLGASQAGARLTYVVDRAHRLALAARIATPLRGRGSEIGLGLDWQPTVLPIHLVAEQRIGLDGSRGGPTVQIVGGFGPVDIAPRVQVEGYGQAGGIARRGASGIEGFADGAARVAYRVAARGRGRFELGLGAWGGAQRGAARLDVGPSLGIVAPVGGKAVRLTLDWRQRVAGAASPGSGPALSIGSDF